MAMLTVRNLTTEVHQRLRERAAEHGRSMEAEARAIIEDAVRPAGPDLVALLRDFADQVQLTDEELAAIFPPRSEETQREVDFRNLT